MQTTVQLRADYSTVKGRPQYTANVWKYFPSTDNNNNSNNNNNNLYRLQWQFVARCHCRSLDCDHNTYGNFLQFRKTTICTREEIVLMHYFFFFCLFKFKSLPFCFAHWLYYSNFLTILILFGSFSDLFLCIFLLYIWLVYSIVLVCFVLSVHRQLVLESAI